MFEKEDLIIASLLLRYPEEKLIADLKEVQTENPYLTEVLNFVKNTPVMEVQQEYVKSFDLTDKATLYLTYHRFRDDPKRGTYLAKLVSYYREKGFEFIENELPDFLPVVLEFIYYQPEEIGIEILRNFEKELNQIQKGLLEINSKYLPVIDFINLLTKREVKQNG